MRRRYNFGVIEKMKKAFIIVLLNILLLLSFSCSINEHDCIEGNCSNGKGTFINSKSEKYIGEFAIGIKKKILASNLSYILTCY